MNRQDGQVSEAAQLLAWYDRHARQLPWRSVQHDRPDPYRVWLSEIMLQQTTVATVKGRFEAFLRRWPTVTALASAALDDVLHEWQGLGYYARARNLHRCAREIAEKHGGRFPDTEEGLLKLPGVGEYTAAAIAAIAFARPTAPVDGNIIRVVTRLRGIEAEMPANKRLVRDAVAPMVPPVRPGDFAQAMMDLGATICTPRKPTCEICPWEGACVAGRQGSAERFPVKPARRARPTRYGTVIWLRDREGGVALRNRPQTGLLGGMAEFPSTPWRDEPWSAKEAVAAMDIEAAWAELPGAVEHTFTHFHLKLSVVVADASAEASWPDGWRAVKSGAFGGEALPTVMKKVAQFVADVQES